ncbi:ZmpA/ZmpB/ZmpC family metallo-endopeptidase, partial [Streptococcus suis]
DFSKYDQHNYGRRLTNKTPERFQSTQDLQDYMRGYLDVIYTLDILEAKSVFAMTDSDAKRNWFNRLTTGSGNTSMIQRVSHDYTTIDQLIDNGMIS